MKSLDCNVGYIWYTHWSFGYSTQNREFIQVLTVYIERSRPHSHSFMYNVHVIYRKLFAPWIRNELVNETNQNNVVYCTQQDILLAFRLNIFRFSSNEIVHPLLNISTGRKKCSHLHPSHMSKWLYNIITWPSNHKSKSYTAACLIWRFTVQLKG